MEVNSNINSGNYGIYSPCHLLREAVAAMLKCLGFDHDKDDPTRRKNPSSSCPDPASTTPQDPTPTPTPSPTGDLAEEDLGRRGSPTRPGISRGPPPQNNSLGPS